MNLKEIKSHAQQIGFVVDDLNQLEAQLNELTRDPLSGTEVNVSIAHHESLTFSKSEIQTLIEQKIEALEVRLECLRREIAL